MTPSRRRRRRVAPRPSGCRPSGAGRPRSGGECRSSAAQQSRTPSSSRAEDPPAAPRRAQARAERDYQKPKATSRNWRAKDFDVFSFGYAQTVPLDVVASRPDAGGGGAGGRPGTRRSSSSATRPAASSPASSRTLPDLRRDEGVAVAAPHAGAGTGGEPEGGLLKEAQAAVRPVTRAGVGPGRGHAGGRELEPSARGSRWRASCARSSGSTPTGW